MLSDNIRNLRKNNNMSQDDLAERLGVSRQSVSLWENGQTQPTVENIIALTKIFNVTANELLDEGAESADDTAQPAEPMPEAEKPVYDKPAPPPVREKTEKKKKSNAPAVIVILVIIFALIAAGAFFAVKYTAFGVKSKGGNPDSPAATGSEIITESKTDSAKADNGKTASAEGKQTQSAPADVSSQGNKTDSQQSAAPAAEQTAAPTQAPAAPVTVQTTAAPAAEFDLFSYCKNFAIQKGEVNGDYTMYQQPSSLYGGYDNEYFSISYWGDSDMVEFCLHCPLDETYSINFYLRMRGGYNGKYEYLSSRYTRSDGVSVRDAKGYIDPAVFSDNYPLPCDEYVGTADKQNDFMEESRVGMCDLIKCLKQFAAVEGMECGFGAFGFVNF